MSRALIDHLKEILRKRRWRGAPVATGVLGNSVVTWNILVNLLQNEPLDWIGSWTR